MSKQFLSARVDESLKRQVKLEAAKNNLTVQDFIGKIVLDYFETARRSSPVLQLGKRDLDTTEAWSIALQRKDDAAVVICKMMELFVDAWNADTARQTGRTHDIDS